jgi:hypothetical protein
MKSASTLIFMNLKSDKYEINDRPGSRSSPIYITIKSTENSIHLKFIDAKNYVSSDMKIDKFISEFGKVQLSKDII